MILFLKTCFYILQVLLYPHIVNNHLLLQSSVLNVRRDRLINAAGYFVTNHLFKLRTRCVLLAQKNMSFWKNVDRPFLRKKKKKRQHRIKLSLTQFWSVFCAYVSSIPHIVVLETMYKMKRVVVSENCSCHSKWSLCGMFFVPFFCHFLMSGVTVNFLSSTVIWHFSEFHRSHTMKLIELFFHIRGWRYKGYIF